MPSRFPHIEEPQPLLRFVPRVRFQVKPNITSPYARLSMEIRQEPNSWEIVTEIDPLDVAEMLGNIGGFWGKGCHVGVHSSSRRAPRLRTYRSFFHNRFCLVTRAMVELQDTPVTHNKISQTLPSQS